MKKYLENLEKELKRLKINDVEITEILEDHKEMITEAQREGISDDELIEKFGDPDKLAKEIFKDTITSASKPQSTSIIGEGKLKGYSLFKAFPGIDDIKEVNIKLVSEDVNYITSEGSNIEVYSKNLNKPEDYIVTFKNGVLSLSRVDKRGSISFSFKRETPDFAITLPKEIVLEEFNYKTVSGDATFDGLVSKKLVINSTSGDTDLSYTTIKNRAKFNTVSGNLCVENTNMKDMEISLVSGDAKLNDVVIIDEITINTVSGNVVSHNLSGNHISFKSVSGDFDGKEVYVDTVQAKSVSGDFIIENVNHDKQIEILSKRSLSGEVTIK